MKNKRVKVLLIIGIILVGISSGIFILGNISNDKESKEKITAIAERFYEDTYYQTTNKEILKDFTETGIIISLEELIEFEEENSNDYKEYNMSKSNIKIYPEKPYDKDNYNIKIKLYRK